MGPALTHVSMKYGDSGWKHVTAEEAEALFPKQSVPAGTRQFICECCGQYVSFTKDGINVRHFKHSRGEEDKTCEERVARNAECEIVQYNTYDFPLRLALDDTDFNLSIGIPQCAIKTKDIKVTVQGKREGGHEYIIRNEAASGLVWLDLNKDIANSYKIKTESRYPNWPEIIAGINPAGTFFDSYGGRRLHEGDEVYAEHDYYMLRKGFEYGRPSMNTNEVLKIGLNGDIWRVYKVRVRSITYDTTAFFLPFSLNLVKDPIDMKVLWPPVVNVDETYYHDSNEVYSAYVNKLPLLLMGPSSKEIADTLSLSVTGNYANQLQCDGPCDIRIIRESYKSTGVLVVTNAFGSDWMISLLQELNQAKCLIVFVHPFIEDISIEASSLYSYCCPISTVDTVDNLADMNGVTGACLSDSFKAYVPTVKGSKRADELMAMSASKLFVRNLAYIEGNAASISGNEADIESFVTENIIEPYKALTQN